MNIDMQDIARRATQCDVTRAIATVLHSHDFTKTYNLTQWRSINFSVTISSDEVPNSIRNGGTGILAFSHIELGHYFLRFLQTRRIKIKVFNKAIRFSVSNSTPPLKLVHILSTVPYQDPSILEMKEKIQSSLISQICVRTLQFGVFYRKPPGLVFSPEWEQDYTDRGDARLAFEYDHKLLRLKTGDHTDTESHSVVITFVNLKRIYIGWDTGHAFILFHLTTPPALETESMYRPQEDVPPRRVRRRVGFFNEGHRRVAPYVHQLRLVIKQGHALNEFSEMCKKAEILTPIVVPDGAVEVLRLNIFSSFNLRRIENWLTKLDWKVAFQCNALMCNLRLNAIELLELQPKINSLAQKGAEYASGVLRHLHTVMRSLRNDEDANAAFTRAVQEFERLIVPNDNRTHLGAAHFSAHHVSFTPTAMRLEGPYTHQSNTVLREYVDYQEYFLRVDFRDENRLQYRWDREVDGATFVHERVGEILLRGFTLGGRKFEFLAYSQSQLRAHSVFFVAPFEHPQRGWVTASAIRKRLGVFDNIIQFPALYAARISQAFSATEPSICLSPDQWEEIDDIKHHNRNFTDGVGSVSPDLANTIWRRLCQQRQQTSPTPLTPKAFQIRFGGYKGMIAVDPRLSGIKMCLRPSMKKFEVLDEENMPLEIVHAFEYPGRMYLNRPLIQIMEDLGIQKEIFMDLQAAVVTDVQTTRNSLVNFANLLESHALGGAFSLPYVLRFLDKIGCEFEHHEQSRAVATPFIRSLIDTAVVSVLRDIKHKARIPVPRGWNLVGVADEGGILGPGQIYVCVWEQGKDPIFLEGWVLISRSPTIHTGDVQMVWAIGAPPRGSIFESEPLPNVVVFPCEGKRDIPSCLGGGDLDGDLYLVCQCPGLLVDPKRCHPPGDYPPTERKDIGRPSTIQDVAEFVVDYINSDVVGLLSTNHLILSDQSPFGTRDRRCLKLAELCSKAVDFPKSGLPVDMAETPRFLIPFKPDWKSDEVINARPIDYYESTRAIGYLYRAIKLEENTKELTLDPKTSDLKDKPKVLSKPTQMVDAISSTIGPIVESHLQSSATLNPDPAWDIRDIFYKFSMELKYICLTHTLSHDPDVRLREEEVVIGTILAKCTQSRWRMDRIAQMRININRLVNLVSAEMNGLDAACANQKLAKAWEAWKHARANSHEFGHQSFGLIALVLTFRALEELEDLPTVTS